ncbi:hypothetical protein AYI70_g2292 [Smittium culicis]|uniref:Uncharacterized protein n=1 Tax=Smittium culicis TaxID=133412 RepID=A0A1R1Y924_9FUNG|nr:hypothetical protein AYI70_g2292 [Smittium culicis]
MDYQPLLLNDSYSTAVKKDDITLNVIQVDLAQATRLIDYYVHPNTGPKSEIQGVQRGPKRLGRFCKDAAAQRSSDGTANIYITPAAQQTEDQLRVQPDPGGGSRLSLIKKRHRGSLYQDSRFLQQPIRDYKEDRWTQICFRSEEVKYTSQSSAIRTVTKSVYFRQDSLPNIFMDENTENPGFSVLGRSIDSREFEGTIFDERRHSVHRIYSSWVQDQIGEVGYYPDSINQAPRNGDKLARDDPQGTSNQDQGPQTRSLEDHEYRNGDFKISGDFYWEGTGHVYSPSSGSSAIRTVTKSVYFRQDSLPNIFMDENTENPGFSVLGRSIDSREFEGTIFDERRHSVHRIYSSWVQDQIGEVGYYPDSINQAPRNGDKLARDDPQGTSNQDQGPQTRSLEDHEYRNGDFKISGDFYWEGTGHVYSPSSGVIDFEETIRDEEHLPLQKEIVDIECDPDRACDPESTILYQPTEILEMTFLPTREPRTEDIHRCQRHGMEDRSGFPILLRIVEYLECVNSHQRQGTINNIICNPAPEYCRTLGISLLRQYHDISLRQDVWRNDFSRVTEDRRKHIEPLLGIKFPSSSHIRAINFEP